MNDLTKNVHLGFFYHQEITHVTGRAPKQNRLSS
jgi:hypothetical protein